MMIGAIGDLAQRLVALVETWRDVLAAEWANLLREGRGGERVEVDVADLGVHRAEQPRLLEDVLGLLTQ